MVPWIVKLAMKAHIARVHMVHASHVQLDPIVLLLDSQKLQDYVPQENILLRQPRIVQVVLPEPTKRTRDP